MELRSSVASPRRQRALRLFGLLTGCAIAAACGQKGPLMLPAAPVGSAAPAASAPGANAATAPGANAASAPSTR